MKMAFQISPVSAAMVDSEDGKLWVVYTLEQYQTIDHKYGSFPRLQSSLWTLSAEGPDAQHLAGHGASMLANAMVNAMQHLSFQPNFKLQLSLGISSINWRNTNNPLDSCTVVCGRSLTKTWFAVVHSLPQLQSLQQQYFPDEPYRVAAFQSGAQLPADSDDQAFVVEGQAAETCILGCHMLGYLG